MIVKTSIVYYWDMYSSTQIFMLNEYVKRIQRDRIGVLQSRVKTFKPTTTLYHTRGNFFFTK